VLCHPRTTYHKTPVTGCVHISRNGGNDKRLQLVLDPQTRAKAGAKPLVLMIDGFGMYETLEMIEFCFASNIILCPLPFPTSHKLQPCDISFGLLKAAYRDQMERLERGGVGTVGKEHFIDLYSPVRRGAPKPHKTCAGWSAAGLLLWNAQKVLDGEPVQSSKLGIAPFNPADTARQQEPQL
jgi:hypothetical protein